jgi:hypothetical protein
MKGLRSKRRSSPCIFQAVESLPQLSGVVVLLSIPMLAQTVPVYMIDNSLMDSL